ncbi:MAG: sulfatase-like hydrolase/transferase [Planctomycetota bacterium]
MIRLPLLVLLLAAFAPAQEDSRPDVLFLFADDLRTDGVGAFGNPHVRTPATDAIVRRGMRFDRNYCLGSMHGAACQPSRAMLMSGRTLYRVPMDLDGVPMFPEVMRGAGYRTFGTGKWHNGAAAFERAFGEADAVLLAGMSDHEKVPLRRYDENGKLGDAAVGPGFSSELFAAAAIRFLETTRDDARPFLCYVSFTAPHDPRQPPLEWRQPYYDRRPPLPRNFLPQHPVDNGWMADRDERLAAWPRRVEDVSDQLCEYYGLISHLDAQIGRIVAAHAALGRGRDLVLVFTSDHGLAMGSHGLLGKQNLYEHSMGCPLAIVGPGIRPGATRALTALVDLAPTLCELTGTTAPPGMEGRSLAPILRRERKAVREDLYLTFATGQRAVVGPRWKLIRYPLIDREQLFDLDADPEERVDLSGDPARADLRRELGRRLAVLHDASGDPHPLRVAEPKSGEIDLSGRPRRPDRFQPPWIVEKYFRD